jgi:hypothetical protein
VLDAHFDACRACVYMCLSLVRFEEDRPFEIAEKNTTGLVIENDIARKILKCFRVLKWVQTKFISALIRSENCCIYFEKRFHCRSDVSYFKKIMRRNFSFHNFKKLPCRHGKKVCSKSFCSQ